MLQLCFAVTCQIKAVNQYQVISNSLTKPFSVLVFPLALQGWVRVELSAVSVWRHGLRTPAARLLGILIKRSDSMVRIKTSTPVSYCVLNRRKSRVSGTSVWLMYAMCLACPVGRTVPREYNFMPCFIWYSNIPSSIFILCSCTRYRTHGMPLMTCIRNTKHGIDLWHVNPVSHSRQTRHDKCFIVCLYNSAVSCSGKFWNRRWRIDTNGYEIYQQLNKDLKKRACVCESKFTMLRVPVSSTVSTFIFFMFLCVG